MSDLEINDEWLRGINKLAHPLGQTMIVALSMNNYCKLEEWANERLPPERRSIWHKLTVYGVPFVYDRRLKDNEVMVKEKP